MSASTNSTNPPTNKIWSSHASNNIPPGAMGSGFQAGFVQTADNRMYNELRAAVKAEERQRRISLGLPPDPPKGMARFKNWLLKREELPSRVGGVDGGGEEIRKM